TKENEKKLEEQRSESLDEIEAAKQEAAKKFDLYEREKRAGLEERFRKNEDRLIEGSINNVYSI
ncbi:MAG: hypothetical protein IJ555_14380, partial [Ruminococcus sp.]|nr:hypothetical protein [Ruminococcus sp.]